MNCRIFPGVKVADVEAKLQEVVGSGVTVKEMGKSMSSDASPLRADVFSAVTRVVQKLHPGVPVVPDQASGATDGLVFRAAGIPTYGVGGMFMRPKDDFSHGLNERIPVDGILEPRSLVFAAQGSRGASLTHVRTRCTAGHAGGRAGARTTPAGA